MFLFFCSFDHSFILQLFLYCLFGKVSKKRVAYYKRSILHGWSKLISLCRLFVINHSVDDLMNNFFWEFDRKPSDKPLEKLLRWQHCSLPAALYCKKTFTYM